MGGGLLVLAVAFLYHAGVINSPCRIAANLKLVQPVSTNKLLRKRARSQALCLLLNVSGSRHSKEHLEMATLNMIDSETRRF
jgi:hypothetical protein